MYFEFLGAAISATDDVMPGVRLRGFATRRVDTDKISPPVEPSSLMMPPMKRIDLPSGDQRGSAIWRSTGGL